MFHVKLNGFENANLYLFELLILVKSSPKLKSADSGLNTAKDHSWDQHSNELKPHQETAISVEEGRMDAFSGWHKEISYVIQAKFG